jgi:hypothetical protein
MQYDAIMRIAKSNISPAFISTVSYLRNGFSRLRKWPMAFDELEAFFIA